MKVLKGKAWSERLTCRACPVRLVVYEGDLKVIITAVGYAGETWEPRVCIFCPKCKTANYPKTIPSGIERNLIGEAFKKFRE